jgi:hypothetical protein
MTEEENVRQMWSEQDLDEALAALNSEVPAGEKALAGARAELMAAAVSPVVIKPKRHKARWIAVIGTAAAVLASVLVVQTISTRSPATVSETLDQAAERIGASDLVVKPGQYLYVNMHTWNYAMAMKEGNPSRLSFLREGTTQIWVPADRTQEWLWRVDLTGKRKWMSGSEADATPDMRESMPPPAVPNCGVSGGTGKECRNKLDLSMPWYAYVANLPTDPRQLYDQLRRDSALGLGMPPARGVEHGALDHSHDDANMFTFVVSTIHGGLATAAQRPALYKALAMMPGLEVIERTTNLDGKPGTGIALTHGKTRYELIVDPATGQPIGQRQTALEAIGDIPAGTVYDETALSTAVVDKIGDKPAG